LRANYPADDAPIDDTVLAELRREAALKGSRDGSENRADRQQVVKGEAQTDAEHQQNNAEFGEFDRQIVGDLSSLGVTSRS
jgi:hypothetical protein